uniref:Uncharacterized protein n=1 Tax=viral metagenome TaxID=1070528 RepID=A0A6C0KYA7_9ZZZZ
MHRKKSISKKLKRSHHVKSRKARGPSMSLMGNKKIYTLEGNIAFPFTPHPNNPPPRQTPPSPPPVPDAKRRRPLVKIIDDLDRSILYKVTKNKTKKYTTKPNSEENTSGDWGQYQHINFEEFANAKGTKRRHHKKGKNGKKKTMHKRH